MEPINGIKIFRISHEDWWAGIDLESCITEAMAQFGDDREDVVDPAVAREITDHEADTLKFVEGDDPCPPDWTFRKELQRMVERGDKFPIAFASTEW